jgi:hypothetical protein
MFAEEGGRGSGNRRFPEKVPKEKNNMYKEVFS